MELVEKNLMFFKPRHTATLNESSGRLLTPQKQRKPGLGLQAGGDGIGMNRLRSQKGLVTVEAAAKMRAHAFASAFRITLQNRIDNVPVFFLKMQVVILGPRTGRCALQFATRDDAGSNELQKLWKTGVLGGLRDCQMKIEVGIPCRAAIAETFADTVMRFQNRFELGGRAPGGRECG